MLQSFVDMCNTFAPILQSTWQVGRYALATPVLPARSTHVVGLNAVCGVFVSVRRVQEVKRAHSSHMRGPLAVYFTKWVDPID